MDDYLKRISNCLFTFDNITNMYGWIEQWKVVCTFLALTEPRFIAHNK